jgi:4-amino-4-deoxy-L-arabinose transferase-like glycosyltransferase
VSRRAAAAATAAIVVLLAGATAWNAATYPPGQGYDAHWNLAYVEGLRERGELPREGAYYTPPGFFSVAAAAMWVGEQAGLGEPRRAAQLVNALLAVATALLVLLLARELWPERPLAHVAAVGLFSLGAWVAKAAAMFHPEPLSLFLSTFALLLAVRMLRRRRYPLVYAAMLGLVLGAAQLVRAFTLWTVAVVLLAFAAAAVADGRARRQVLAAAGVVAAFAALVAAPWYVRQVVEFRDPIFAPPAPEQPLWERRPASFYLDPGLPEVITAPHRPHFVNRFFPQLYADAWGDWFGAFAWDSGEPRATEGPGVVERRPDPGERRRLVAQSLVGIVPTALALGGWLALLVAAFRPLRPHLVPVALLPLAGIAGMLYFTVSYPTPDGDVIKAQYMLTTAPAWALAFALAVDRLARRRAAAVALALVLCPAALVSWAFTLYGYPLGP